MLVWCLLASVLAALTWRRHGGASVVLLVSCGVATLFEVVAFPFSLLHIAASVTAFVLLLRPSTRSWFQGSHPARVVHDWPPPAGTPVPPDASQQPQGLPPGKPPVW
jgi:hypothetical protein